MSIIKVNTCYYEQFDADHDLDVPGKAYGGWKKKELDLDLDRTAIIVMHAWDHGKREDYPGWYRAVEYIKRSRDIMDNLLPDFLSKVRNSPLKLIHMGVAGRQYHTSYPGYKRTLELSGPEPEVFETVERGETVKKLALFKRNFSVHGTHNIEDISRGFENTNFYKTAMPVGNEYVCADTRQLLSICKHEGIDHLIYTGFAINACLFFSPGGMAHISNHGIMCSTIRQLVTAVENKESAQDQQAKELALWWTAIAFGYVYDLDDLISKI